MAKKEVNLKFKYLLLLIITNLLSYLMAYSDEPTQRVTNDLREPLQRDGYIKVIIKAKLLTEFEENKVVSVHTSHNHKVIEYAILLKNLSASSSGLTEMINQETYLIYIHEKYLTRVMNQERFRILPYTSIGLKKIKAGKNYEISL